MTDQVDDVKRVVSLDAWKWAADTFGHRQLLPVVQVPDMPKERIAAKLLGGYGKRPSRIDGYGQAHGLKDYETPAVFATTDDTGRPEYGIGVKGHFAIDVDTEDAAVTAAVRAHVELIFGDIPIRVREGSAHIIVPFRAAPGSDVQKLRLRLDDRIQGGPAVEFLGTRGYYNLVGVHVKSGKRYEIIRQDATVPELTEEQWLALYNDIADLLAVPDARRSKHVANGERGEALARVSERSELELDMYLAHNRPPDTGEEFRPVLWALALVWGEFRDKIEQWCIDADNGYVAEDFARNWDHASLDNMPDPDALLVGCIPAHPSEFDEFEEGMHPVNMARPYGPVQFTSNDWGEVEGMLMRKGREFDYAQNDFGLVRIAESKLSKIDAAFRGEAVTMLFQPIGRFNIEHGLGHAGFYQVMKSDDPEGKPKLKNIKISVCRAAEKALQQRALEGFSEAPFVKGILRHPIVAPTGEILSGDGCISHGLAFVDADVRDVRPFAVGEAREALPKLRAMLASGFLLENQDLLVAALLTTLQRQMIDEAPGFLYVAAQQATGKTACQFMPLVLANGSEPTPMSWPYRPEEAEKAAFASLMAGSNYMCIDNVPDGSTLRLGNLATALTSSKWKGRVLGLSEERTVSCAVPWSFSGNNVEPDADAASRLIVVRLTSDREDASQMERPHKDHLSYLLSIRDEVLRLAIGIVAGYVAAGRPEQGGPRGRFAQWLEQVRDPLRWAGGAEIADAFAQVGGEDAAAIEDLWRALPKGERFTAKGIVDSVDGDFTGGLATAIRAFDADPGSARSVSQLLRKYIDRPVSLDGELLRLKAGMNLASKTRWFELT